LNIRGDDGDGRRRGGGAGVKGSGSGGQTGGTATRATSSAARGGRRAHQQATASGTRATWRRVRGEGRFKDTLGRGTKRVNDDEPGNEDVPPHHHGKLTTRTTTRRRCSEAQDNRRAWRRRGRARLHRPAAADCRISDSGWRTQVATAARLMVADGCGLRQRTKHVEDDQGEL